MEFKPSVQLTPFGVASFLKEHHGVCVQTQTVRKWVASGALRGVNVGPSSRVIITVGDLEEALNAGRIPPGRDISAKGEE